MKPQKQKGHGHSCCKTCCKIVAVGILACYLPISPADAAITFQFEYDDPADTGFLDPVFGATRQAALNTAASTFSTVFGSHFSNSGTITLQVTGSNEPYSTTLAAAGSMAVSGSEPGFNLGEVIRTKLQNGIDLNGNNADGVVEVNFAKPWDLDFNTPASSDQYDFYSIMYHEFTHALGFTSTIEEPGTSRFRSSWGAFDSFITDKHGTKIIDPVTFTVNQLVWDINKTDNFAGDGSEGLFFGGSNAVAANGGLPVALYTPFEWNNGSSVSHLDNGIVSLEELMMTPSTGTGPRTHDYSAVEIGILTDLGYVAMVPEPETYSMMLAGLVTCSWIARRRKIKNLA